MLNFLKRFGFLGKADSPRPPTGIALQRLPEDRYIDEESIYMAMERLDAIMEEANNGNPGRLYKLASELLDKNVDIASAVGTRVDAVKGIAWEIVPGGPRDADRAVAGMLRKEMEEAGSGSLGLTGTTDLIGSIAHGRFVGISINETIFKPGGSIDGFLPVQTRFVSFEDSYFNPTLHLRDGSIYHLTPEKFIVSLLRDPAGDPSRGGLIRPLSYFHVFFNRNIKSLVRYLERYGMPITVAKVGQTTWEKEREVVKAVVRRMGADGGAVVNNETDILFSQAAPNGSDGFFKFEELNKNVVDRIVLGQTATSSSGGGLSKNDAQSQVRQDLIEADCKMVEEVINTRLIPIWMAYNFGAKFAAPRFKMLYVPTEDQKAKAEALQAEGEALGSFVRAGFITPDLETEIEARKKAGMPPPSQAVIDYYKNNDGIKQPVTLKTKGESQSPFGGFAMTALPAPSIPATSAAAAPQAVSQWVAKPLQALKDFIDGTTDEIPAISLDDFDNGALADHIVAEEINSMAIAKLRESKELADQMNRKGAGNG